MTFSPTFGRVFSPLFKPNSLDGANNYWVMDASKTAQYAGATVITDAYATAVINYTYIPGTGTITHRCRQHGYITSVKAHCTATTVLKFKIFRLVSPDITFVCESEEVTFASGITTETLATPLPCRPGDYLGVYVKSGKLALTNVVNGCYYTMGDITSTYTLLSQAPSYLNYTGYGVSPYLAVTGDSIAVGYNGWQSFYDTGPAGTLTSEPWYILRGLIDSSQSGGFEYQNHGNGGETWAWVLSTGFVSAEATKAKVILVHCGVNDVNAGRTWEQVVADINAVKVLFAASTTADKLLINEILPWTNGNDTQAALIRTWNSNLAAWVATNNDISGKSIGLVVMHDDMGQTRGSTGELDDLLTAYNDDGVHPNATGYAKMAEIILPYMN